LRPSLAATASIPARYLQPSVRTARYLPNKVVTRATLDEWIRADEPVLLLRVSANETLPAAVIRYLRSPEAIEAQKSYKCRNRRPWYVVPDVKVPDAFLSYMSGRSPALVANAAQCSCTNSLHAVKLTNGTSLRSLQSMWQNPLTQLSCEIEGHPLGGGMLKLEPREAARVVLPKAAMRISRAQHRAIEVGIAKMREWRHYV